MKILMLGWEFPPLFAGGVGIVCYELTKALSQYEDVEITYIMPFGPRNFGGSAKTNHINLLIANNIMSDFNVKVKIETVRTMFHAYMTDEEYLDEYDKFLKNEDITTGSGNIYGENLYLEVERFAERVREIAKKENFDVIHAHDWMTIPAGIYAKEISGKPLVLHVHNTVYDRYLGSGGDYEKRIEQKGLDYADRIIAISKYPVIQNLQEHYNIDMSRVRLVHNGGITDIKKSFNDNGQKKNKTVLYAGRVVLQKGPEFFIRMAAKVLEYEPETKFILAGTGHLLEPLKKLAYDLGIGDKIYFHGFYTREYANKFFSEADIFIMPSVSEPFGIVPLEAISKGTVSIISKQSGIAECLNNCFKTDYWDIDAMANNVVALIRYPELYAHMKTLSYNEYDKFSWDKPAKKVLDIYREAIDSHNI